MKRTIFTALVFLMLAVPLFMPLRARAQAPIFEDACDGETSQSPVCTPEVGGNNISGQNGIIMQVVNILSFVIGVAAVIIIIYGGLKYITSNGDANSIASAKNTVIYALIGIVIFLFSQAIVIFVIRRL